MRQMRISKMLAKSVLFFVLVSMICLQVGCTGPDNYSDVKTFIVQAKSQPNGNIEPLPKLQTYQTFSYSAADLRSPFISPKEIVLIQHDIRSGVRPDFKRKKDYLESFDIDDLKMVGIIANAGEETRPWALVHDNNGNVHKIQIGNYLGKNHGKVISISSSKIEVMEIISDGDNRWMERPRQLELASN